MELSDLLSLCRQKRGYRDLGRGATREEIEKIEEVLELSLPDSYRAMLETVGYIRWFGESILGVAENEHYDTLSNTLSLRSEQRPSDFLTVPRDGNVIQNYAGGGYYFLFSKASKRSGEVALFTDELFGNEEQSWSSFAEFLNYKIE